MVSKASTPKNDWRLHTFSYLSEGVTLPWNGKYVPAGSRVTVSSIIQLTKKKTVTIPLPNATALMLNASARAYREAKRLRTASGIDRSLQSSVSFDSDECAFDYIERMMEAVILAFAGLEAYINESIPSDYEYVRHHHSEEILEVAGKEKIERHIPIGEKLTAVLPDIFKCESPKGSRCWHGYVQLKNIRDRIIHMKTEDRKSSGPELDTIWKALFLMPAPHIVAKEMIDHFVKAASEKPLWHQNYPSEKMSQKM
jgi:hypothetical protein